jgi:hypothetical protein
MPISPQITVTPEDIVIKNFDITAVTRTSTTATYTATGHTFSAGDIVLVSGIFPDGYNGTFTLTSVATNTFTVSNATNLPITDPVGNAFWADAAEYEYEDLSAVYGADSDDLQVIDLELATIEIAVNGKNKIYRQPNAPSIGLTEGDIWFDTDDGNKQYYWTGTAWVSVRDLGIAAAEAGAAAALEGAAAAEEAATAANIAATAAQNTADGKNKVYRQATAPTGTLAIGDLWFNTSEDNKPNRWNGSSWEAYGFGNLAIGNLDAAKISTGYLAAARIEVASLSGDKITGRTILAEKLAVGTISAVEIAAGTITGAKIAAGTITAGNIATATITADQIAGATITAAEIAAGSITVDRLTAGTLTAFTLQTSSGARRVTVSASTNAISFRESDSVVGFVGPTSISGVIMHYGSSFNANATAYPQAYVSSGDARIAFNSTTYVQASSTGVVISGNLFSLTNFYNQDTTTTANAANTWMSATNGLTRRSTASSQRYKENIVELRSVIDLDPNKLLELPVRAFTYKTDYLDSADDRAGLMLPGFIAEEVADIYPIAADKVEGVVESWNDRFVVPGMLSLIQDLHKRIQTLEGEING